MHASLRLLLGLAASFSLLSAQDADPASASSALSRAEVEKLVGPIALYPDPLVALILPAATRPSDIVLAARHLERGGSPHATGDKTWEPSVKALVHYREVITRLDEDLAWTVRLGEAFLAQPADVFGAIQTLRRRALDAGVLADSREHEVVVEEGEIRILPARPTYVHVPRYDPEILHVERVRYVSRPRGPFITFSTGYVVGPWLCYEPDWYQPSIRIVHRPTHWYHAPDWRWHHRHRHAGHRWSRWQAPPHRHDRPRVHSPRPDHRAHPPRHERREERAPAPGDRRDRHPGDRRPDHRRPEPSVHEPLRPGEVAPLASIPAPVLPDLTPVVPDLAPVQPPFTRAAEPGPRLRHPAPHADHERRHVSPRTRPEARATAAAPVSAQGTPVPAAVRPRHPGGESAERPARGERRGRAEDDPRLQREER